MTTAIAPTQLNRSEVDELTKKINEGMKKAADAVSWIIKRVSGFLNYLPGFIADRVRPFLQKLDSLARKLLKKLGELLVGIAFPVIAYLLANDWVERVKNPVTTVSGAVSDANLNVDTYWQGKAADAYEQVVPPQTAAMGEVAAIVDSLKTHLWVLGGVIGGFYVALAIVLYQWIGVLTASTAATATGVGAVAGVPAAAADTGISAAAVWGLVAAAVALVADQLKTFTDLHNRVSTSDKFPHGHWPKATTGAFSDASEKDGDTTDWHIK